MTFGKAIEGAVILAMLRGSRDAVRRSDGDGVGFSECCPKPDKREVVHLDGVSILFDDDAASEF